MIVDKRTILRSILIVISVILVVSVSGIALSLMQVPLTIPSAGAVKGVGVAIYWDSACTNPVSSIGWGTVDPGASTSKTVYIKNTGNAAATLTKTVRNWTPTNAANYLSFSWNYANQVIGNNKVQQVTLTLSAMSNATAIATFNFDLVITASG
jgi:hypothetical protein